jgi:hypothetical protein
MLIYILNRARFVANDKDDDNKDKNNKKNSEKIYVIQGILYLFYFVLGISYSINKQEIYSFFLNFTLPKSSFIKI